MKLKIKATDESLQEVNTFIHSVLPKDSPDIILNQIDLAVEEIFVNIAHYSGSQEANINCTMCNDILTIVFSDAGTPFNPLEKPDPDITLSAEEREIGGLGIFLTKKFMDSVDYEFTNGKNVLTITKKITQQ